MHFGFRYRLLPSGAHLRVMSQSKYDSWSKEDLIARLLELEGHSKRAPKMSLPVNDKKPFHFSAHPVRKIAVKFCYSGWEYNGLAFQDSPTPLPTVEEVLFKAFAKTKLIDNEAGSEGCGWEKCGRTDRGVSAAGQVISLWVRSALVAGQISQDPNKRIDGVSEQLDVSLDDSNITDRLESAMQVLGGPPARSQTDGSLPSDLRRQELRYISMLNRVLPPTIRVLAWSPVSPTFSARFNCQHRHYKYFFTSHGLDISLMQQAANLLIGEHDFRNLCKLDPAKQITNFNRRVLRADINRVPEAGNNNVFVFDLVGSAFLYHQVRHIMAILFLVGTGVEKPSIITSLMNVDASVSADLEFVDRKPEYQMADALPLMLWDCAYAESDVQWETGVVESGSASDLYHQLHSIHQRSLIHTTLDAHFLSATTRYHPPPPQYFPFSETGLTTSTIPPKSNSKESPILSIPLGGGMYTRCAKYIPVLLRKRLDHVEVANERWRAGKGGRREERKKATFAAASDGEE
ncbi:pseudouridine synthase [Hygrophoropsis aurantiaca]|uniref:Pseudouridine synthase n=1 Tax=Hygrophoropsis aurantiaca TaxID=72124 RepID=A0ACB8A8F7_9AGAM|nr:pseudouridine synthase [Hygrophoropsis aurantiaca]